MKKFLVTLFILAALGAGGFFLGWAQLTVPPGAYGLVNSKTHGIDPRLIRSGEFRWIWYKLIPTNVTVTVFRLEPVTHRLNARNTLPSGSTYAAFAGIDADFSWEVSGTLSFSINPDTLIEQVSANGIGGQEALDAWEQGLAERIAAFALSRLNSTGTNALLLEEILKTGASPELEQEIRDQFPMISGFFCLFSAAKFPDFALYNQARGLYEDFTARQREYLGAVLGKKAENRIDSRLRFEELEQYGALLSKYPALLEYLTLEKDKKE